MFAVMQTEDFPTLMRELVVREFIVHWATT